MESTRRTDKLRKLFVRNHIVDIKELFQALETNSRMTVFRHLNKNGYLSSYSHAGRYYTLEYIPRFDSSVLWHFRDVSFSRFGTLKSTIIHLIENASTGMTHRELAKLLHLPVHHTVRNLVNSNIVSREHVEKLFLYVSHDSEVSSLQISRRKEQIEAFPRVRPLNPKDNDRSVA